MGRGMAIAAGKLMQCPIGPPINNIERARFRDTIRIGRSAERPLTMPKAFSVLLPQTSLLMRHLARSAHWNFVATHQFQTSKPA